MQPQPLLDVHDTFYVLAEYMGIYIQASYYGGPRSRFVIVLDRVADIIAAIEIAVTLRIANLEILFDMDVFHRRCDDLEMLEPFLNDEDDGDDDDNDRG